MGKNVIIRYAKIEDLQAVYVLVRALAEFENGLKKVSSTLKDYEDAFKSSLIGIIVAELNSEIIGMALYYDTFSTWKGKMLYLEDFIVHTNHRSQGIGKQIFDAVINEAHLRNCKMMKWQVLDWNSRAFDFYSRYNCTLDKEWIDCKLYFE